MAQPAATRATWSNNKDEYDLRETIGLSNLFFILLLNIFTEFYKYAARENCTKISLKLKYIIFTGCGIFQKQIL